MRAGLGLIASGMAPVVVGASDPEFIQDLATDANTGAGAASRLVDMATAGTIAAGNYLIARVMLNNSGTSGAAVTLTVSDARNGSWTVDGPTTNTGGAVVDGGAAAYIAYVKVASTYTNGDDVTFSFSPNCTGYAMVIEEWSGIHATTPIAVSAQGATGTGAINVSVSITPSATNQLVYCCYAKEGGGTDGYTEDSDTTNGTWVTLTGRDNGSATAGGVEILGAYKLVTASGAQTWQPQGTVSRDWAVRAVCFASAS